MSWNEFWKTIKRNWRAAVYLLVLAALAVLLVVVCVRRGQTAAQPEPTPRTSAQVQQDAAQMLLDGMTTREKICQLLIVHPEVLTDGGMVTAVTDKLSAALQDYPVGGFLLSAGNMTSGEQLSALTSALSAACPTAPLVTVDEEGGRVARLMNTVGTTKLNSMYSYRGLGTQVAYDNAQTLARDIAAYGFNTDFAPVADVWTNRQSNAIGDRAYSDDYDEAAELVAAAVSGFRDAGIICCLKHFPGHGSTAADSHNGAATVDKTLPQLRQEDLKPFVSGIAAGADMVMVGHLTVLAMDDLPASLSHKIVTNLLRYDLGFRGVIVTDGLQMQALAQYTDGEKAVLALSAGNDMLLEISDVPGTVAAVEQALADGTLTQAALDQSVLRVLQLKLSHGIVPLPEIG
ncbi:MAG: glycoside hydrolase family 3 N-terminal domain-containing protein [Oscillospiraceae bacterium]